LIFDLIRRGKKEEKKRKEKKRKKRRKKGIEKEKETDLTNARE